MRLKDSFFFLPRTPPSLLYRNKQFEIQLKYKMVSIPTSKWCCLLLVEVFISLWQKHLLAFPWVPLIKYTICFVKSTVQEILYKISLVHPEIIIHLKILKKSFVSSRWIITLFKFQAVLYFHLLKLSSKEISNLILDFYHLFFITFQDEYWHMYVAFHFQSSLP